MKIKTLTTGQMDLLRKGQSVTLREPAMDNQSDKIKSVEILNGTAFIHLKVGMDIRLELPHQTGDKVKLGEEWRLKNIKAERDVYSIGFRDGTWEEIGLNRYLHATYEVIGAISNLWQPANTCPEEFCRETAVVTKVEVISDDEAWYFETTISIIG